MDLHPFRQLLIATGALPPGAEAALERSLVAAEPQDARAAQMQAARVLLAETDLDDADVAALVDLSLAVVACLRRVGRYQAELARAA